jgi:ABC-type antimicrobial peptide transport system permease subunit
MMEIYLFATAALVFFGIAIGVILVVSLGIHREERNYSLRQDTTDRVLRGTRRVTGFTSTSSA